MELVIVRRAIACAPTARRWPHYTARPLSPRGGPRARQAAAGLKHLTDHPVRVLSSPLLRVRQTAEILARCAGWPAALPCPLLAPGGSPEPLLALLGGLRGARIAVVGHEPDLGHLLAACLPGKPAAAAFRLKKMSVALVRFSGRAQAARGTLAWLAPPRRLRAAV